MNKFEERIGEAKYFQVAQSRSGTTRIFKIAGDRYVQVYLCKSGRIEFTDNLPAIPAGLTLHNLDQAVWIEKENEAWHFVDSRRQTREVRETWLAETRHFHPAERPTFEEWLARKSTEIRAVIPAPE